MSRPRTFLLPVVSGLIAIGAVAALGVAGWSKHGEAIFLSTLESAWASCF